jgi:hypothetical protein
MDLFHDLSSPLSFLVALPLHLLVASPPPLPCCLSPLLVLVLVPSVFLLLKATTITSVVASFASTTYNQEVLFSPTITATHNHAI